LKDWIAQVTKPVRHGLVRRVAPKLWRDAHRRIGAAVPRPMTIFAKKHFGERRLLGAEIGVAGAINAESILKTLNVEMLYLIDPYSPYFQDDRFTDVPYDRSLEAAKERLTPLSNWKIVQLSSDEAVSEIPDYLDFVYIDGNHDYSHVRNDLRNYYPKVKSGGLLGGHDFSTFTPEHYNGLINAVIEFVVPKKIPLHCANTDFWVVKP